MYNLNDTDENELRAERKSLTVGRFSAIARPIVTSNGTSLVNEANFKPLDDIADTMEIYERRTDGGQRYFVVKYGMLVVAVIMALEIQKELVSELEDLAACCRVVYAYQNKEMKQSYE